MPDEYMYCDYEGSGIPAGSEVSTKDVKFNKSVSDFLSSFRSLTKLGMTSEVSGLYSGITGSLTVTAETEIDLKRRVEEHITKEATSTLKTKYKIGQHEDYGTVTYKVDCQFGGILTTVTTGSITALWTAKNVEQFRGMPLTPTMRSMIFNCAGANFPDVPRKSWVFPPLQGKTCHHVKFVRVHQDGCVPDGEHCVALNGKEFVVCHHHDMKWIGGPSCSCSRIDKVNVVRVPASSLANLYKAIGA